MDTNLVGFLQNRADNNAQIHPDVLEVCNDGIDNDCDTKTDCADPECAGQKNAGGWNCCQAVTDCPAASGGVNPTGCVDVSCGGNVCNYAPKGLTEVRCYKQRLNGQSTTDPAYCGNLGILGEVLLVNGAPGIEYTLNAYTDSKNGTYVTTTDYMGAMNASNASSCKSTSGNWQLYFTPMSLNYAQEYGYVGSVNVMCSLETYKAYSCPPFN